MADDRPNPIFDDFWVRPADDIEADLADIRSKPLSFYPEPVPEPDFPLPQGPGYWAVTKLDDILTISKNPKTFSSAAGITVADNPPEFNEFFGSMIQMDDPRHARLRKVVSAGFTPRMLRSLEDGVAANASRIVTDVADRGKVDFVVDVAAALPLQIVCDMMGVPQEYYQTVFDQTNVILGAGDPEYMAESEDFLGAILGAGATLAGVMHEVADSKRGTDSDDLTSIMVNAEIDGERLTNDDLASFFVLLVVAGNETTRNAISWGLKFLTDNPDQRALLESDFDAHMPGAVDEIVRLSSPVTYMRRTATEDTEVGGQAIAAGEKLCMFYLAANRDEDHFTNPYAFDITRDNSSHVGFGGPGPHFCLGAHLARREITVMFREILTRLPDIRATSEPDLLRSSFIHGVKHMDAEFTPA